MTNNENTQSKAETILLYGRTRAGKTTQIGELAEHIYKTTGKKTRIYSIDKGGVNSVLPYIKLGIIEPVLAESTSPWFFLSNAVRGNTRDANGKWILDIEKNNQIGLFVFESLTAFADALMTDLAIKAAEGVNIGGGASVSFNVTDAGSSMKIGGNNQSHYNVVQMKITEEVWQSFRLPAQYIMWTASVSKEDDSTTATKVLGPEVAGKKLTAECPRWFQYTFRIDCTPATKVGAVAKPESHILYLGNSVDVSAGNAVSLGNTRTPLDASSLPSSIEPASVTKALEMINGCQDEALIKIKKRIGL